MYTLGSSAAGPWLFNRLRSANLHWTDLGIKRLVSGWLWPPGLLPSDTWEMMFGRTSNVGLDPFSRYSGCIPWAVVRPDCGCSIGCGRPTSIGKVWLRWLRLAVVGLKVGAGHLGCAGGLPLACCGLPRCATLADGWLRLAVC